METSALLPCPFCGSDELHHETHDPQLDEPSIRCRQCSVVVLGDSLPQGAYEPPEVKWNRRALLQPKPDWATLPRVPELLSVIRAYTEEVNRRAEAKMLQTGKLEGSHHAAMREINQELGI